jgi:hypothetical protein
MSSSRKRLAVTLAALLGGAAATLVAPAVSRAEHRQFPVVRVHAETEVLAKPGVVWAHITTGRNLVTWCPQWKSAKNSTVTLSHVGDVLDYTDEWGHGGHSVVTYLKKGEELRVAHEPTAGDYMCQAKLILAPTAKGTNVALWDQYTDESSPVDLAATADKMEKELAATLAALKRDCEAHHSLLPTLHVSK